MKKLSAVITAIICLSFADNMLVNAGFEQDLGVGWTSYTSTTNDTINRATGYHPDPDYEAFVFKGTGAGYAKLSQDVAVPQTDLDFSIDAKLYAYDNNADTLCWAAAAVVVTYQNALGGRLGQTRICAYTTPCPWVNNPTTHLIMAPDSLWHTYAFNVATELANLPGVNPALVKNISIALYDTTNHSC